MFLIVLAALLCFSSCANGNYWSNCPGSTNSATSVTVTGCDSSMSVCNVKRGSNVTVQISAVAPEVISTANVAVTAYVGLITYNYQPANPDACQDPNSGMNCPISQGTPFTSSYELQIPSNLTPVSATVKISMKDQNSVTDFCVNIQIQVT